MTSSAEIDGRSTEDVMVSKSVFIQELVRDGDRWRMSIGEVGSTDALWRELYPMGTTPPYGVTIAEEMVQTEPHLIGHFFIGGVNGQAVQAMEQGYAEAFRAAGFTDGAAEGMVRTWIPNIEQPWDMPEEEATQLFCDNFTAVVMPNLSEMTIWDPVLDQVCDFQYANGKTFRVRLGDIEQSSAPASFLWNDSNFLLVPVDDSWQPVLNARTTLNMFQFRYGIEKADNEIRAQQLEIGFMVNTFAKAIRDLAHGANWRSPVDAFRAGLRS
jgi:hypothetical protein